MQHFLLKTEPSDYSYDDLLRDKKTTWSGVANNAALKHIRSMKKGDTVLIYHTGDEKQIVGLATIISDPYPDPHQHDPKLIVIDIQANQKLKKPVTLALIKSLKYFSRFPLVTISRLSVMPVSDEEWEHILSLSK
ncbi:MAG: EVE domain-containing protein [Bacteroidota bacterium]|nr:EVE domain-containing protein [Bacteroidota bacterium]